MSQEVTAYRASDGSLYLNKAECDDYEFDLSFRPRLKTFFENPTTPYRDAAHRSMVTKAIIAWERFKLEPSSRLQGWVYTAPKPAPELEALGLGNRAVKGLSSVGILTTAALCQRSPRELWTINNIGYGTINDIQMRLKEHNLLLRPDPPVPNGAES